MDPRAEHIQKILDLNQGLVLRCLDGVSDEHFVAPRDGGNSMQWLFGHLTGSRVVMARLVGTRLEFPYREQFQRGSVRGAPDDMPGADELKERWNAACVALSAGLAAAPVELLDRALPAEGPPTTDGTILGCVAFMTMHDSYHLGQLGWLRKAFGYPGIAG